MASAGRGRSWLGLVFVAAGLFILGVALVADDAGFHAPRWVVAVIGGVAVLSGILVRRGDGGGAPGDGLATALLVTLLLTGFAVTILWVLLEVAPGSGRVSTSLPFWFLVPAWVDRVFFYTLVGSFALLVGFLALAAWRDLLRRIAARVPGPLGRLVVPAGALVLLGPVAWAGYERYLAQDPGPGEPLVSLSFEGSLADAGPHGVRGAAAGDEVGFVPGVRGQALFVGGTEDWVDYALPPAVDLTRSVTLEFWFRREDWRNPYAAGSGVQTIVGAGHLTVGLNLHRRPAVRPVGSVGGTRAGDPAVSVPPETWIHVALVYDRRRSAVRLHLDGHEVARAPRYGAPALERQDSLRIGTWHRANQAFRGAVDELRLYGYARSAAEIRTAASARGG